MTGLVAFSLQHSGLYQRVSFQRAAFRHGCHFSTLSYSSVSLCYTDWEWQRGGQQLLIEMQHSFTISVLTKLQRLWSRLSKMTKVFCVLIVGVIALLAFASAGGDDATKKGPKVTDKVGQTPFCRVKGLKNRAPDNKGFQFFLFLFSRLFLGRGYLRTSFFITTSHFDVTGTRTPSFRMINTIFWFFH